MSAINRYGAILAVALILAGCAGTGSTSDRPRTDFNLLTEDQIRAAGYSNLFQVVEALRPTWLRTRGMDSINTPTQVLVYLDGTRLGGIRELQAIGIGGITFLRYYDGREASARWGLDHGQGVIYVSTRPR